MTADRTRADLGVFSISPSRRFLLAAVPVALVAGACSPSPTPPSAPPPSPTITSAPKPTPDRPAGSLVNPVDYAARDSRYPSWGFVTPSSRWICVIATAPSNGDRAACAANPDQGPLPVPGIPSATNNDGTTSSRPPNVMTIRESADPDVEWLDELIWEDAQAPAVLPYGDVLSAGGMTCNAQEVAVSCREDSTGKGFSLSTTGYRFAYTDVPAR